MFGLRRAAWLRQGSGQKMVGGLFSESESSERIARMPCMLKRCGSNRLLNKCVQVGNIRFKSLEPGSCWRELCRSHGTFQPLRLLRTGPFGAPGIASPLSGHAIRAFGAVVA